MNIYQRIQNLAKQKNISIRELERVLDFSEGSINKWHDSAPVSKLNQVADHLHTSIDYLIGNDVKNDYKSMWLAKKISSLSDDDISLISKLVDRLNWRNDHD